MTPLENCFAWEFMPALFEVKGFAIILLASLVKSDWRCFGSCCLVVLAWRKPRSVVFAVVWPSEPFVFIKFAGSCKKINGLDPKIITYLTDGHEVL